MAPDNQLWTKEWIHRGRPTKPADIIATMKSVGMKDDQIVAAFDELIDKEPAVKSVTLADLVNLSTSDPHVLKVLWNKLDDTQKATLKQEMDATSPPVPAAPPPPAPAATGTVPVGFIMNLPTGRAEKTATGWNVAGKPLPPGDLRAVQLTKKALASIARNPLKEGVRIKQKWKVDVKSPILESMKPILKKSK